MTRRPRCHCRWSGRCESEEGREAEGKTSTDTTEDLEITAAAEKLPQLRTSCGSFVRVSFCELWWSKP